MPKTNKRTNKNDVLKSEYRYRWNLEEIGELNRREKRKCRLIQNKTKQNKTKQKFERRRKTK